MRKLLTTEWFPKGAPHRIENLEKISRNTSTTVDSIRVDSSQRFPCPSATGSGVHSNT